MLKDNDLKILVAVIVLVIAVTYFDVNITDMITQASNLLTQLPRQIDTAIHTPVNWTEINQSNARYLKN